MMEERISEEENEDVFEDLQHEQRDKHQPPMICRKARKRKSMSV